MKKILLGLCLAGLVGGCGGSSNNCDYRQTANAQQQCVEYSGLNGDQANVVMAACTGFASGKWSSGGCSHTGSLGGCSANSGGVSSTTWYYPDTKYNITTAAQVMQACGRVQGGAYVSP